MKALILAAGEGTRMLPLTANIPKPLLPVAGKPFLQHTIEGLKSAGIKDITILVGWRSGRVREHFDDWIAAWEEALTETSTDWAPWHVAPADRNWVKALAVGELLVHALERLDPQLPEAEEGLDGLQIT